MNARYRPSGENIGRRSNASSATSRCAAPPVAGTDQMSPPEENAISLPSGEMPGSANAYFGGALADWGKAPTVPVAATRVAVAAISVEVTIKRMVENLPANDLANANDLGSRFGHVRNLEFPKLPRNDSRGRSHAI